MGPQLCYLCPGAKLSNGCGCPLPLQLKLHEIWSVDSQENNKNYCRQISDFKAKMHQIRFRLGFHPTPRWGSLQRSPDPLRRFKGADSRQGGRRGRMGKGMGEGWGGRRRGGEDGRERKERDGGGNRKR